VRGEEIGSATPWYNESMGGKWSKHDEGKTWGSLTGDVRGGTDGIGGTRLFLVSADVERRGGHMRAKGALGGKKTILPQNNEGRG